jgi:hypothetical protein
MSLRTLRCAAAIAAGLAPTGLAAQDTAAAPAAPAAVLRGRVIDAAVALTAGRDTLGTGHADGAGYFTVALRAARDGEAHLFAHFLRFGFRRDSLALDMSPHAPLLVAMTPLGDSAVALRPTRVTAPRPSAIAERVRRAGGTYIGEADIARRAPGRTADLFRGVPGVSLHDDGGRTQVVSGRRVEMRPGATRAAPPAAGADSTGDPLEGVSPPGSGSPCVLRVGLDGQLMPEDFSVDDVPLSDVAEVEIYRGAATVPIALSSTRGVVKCGAVMIWTRRGARRAR